MKTNSTLFTVLFVFIAAIGLAAPEAVSTVKVNVIGQVAAPATYEVASAELNLHSLVLRAGGPTQAARGGQGVTIIRSIDGQQKKMFHKIDVFQLLKDGAESKLNIAVQPNDVVFIMERVF